MHDEHRVTEELERQIINLNHNAMEALSFNEFEQAHRLLKTAEAYLFQVDGQISRVKYSVGHDSCTSEFTMLSVLKNKLFGLTYNNLGCAAKQ
jgi:exonuclease VII small subunit